MKSLTKRIISSLLCAAITAVSFGVCGVAAVSDDDIAAGSGVRGVASPVSAAPKAAGNNLFEDRSAITLGSDSDSIAIKQADPYGTAGSDGNGSKWATLAVVPEVYTMYGRTGTLIDYKGSNVVVSGGSGTLSSGESPQISTNELNMYGYMQTSAGMNLGNGKNDTVARLRSDSSGALYLEVCDPVNGGWKTDRDFRVTWNGYIFGGSVSGECVKQSLTDVTPQSGAPYAMLYFDGKFKIASCDSLKDRDQNVRGQYLSVAAGDFDGDGTDTIIAYIPDFSSPQIKEYKCEKRDISDFNANNIGSIEYKFGSTNGSSQTPHYYQPTVNKVISSNVYTTFELTKTNDSTGTENESRNVPIVDLVAADVDRDGCDELIVTAGLGDTTKTNNCSTVMKIYDFVDGKFTETYTKKLQSDNYNGQSGRIRWASSAVGNVQVGASGALGTDFPEIVTAGWVDGKTDAGIAMKHRWGVHITGLVSIEEKNGTYVGTYAETLVTATSDRNLDSNHLDGVSVHMKDGFPAWTRHDRLAVGTLAYRGLESAAAIMLGDTVYDITSENKLSAAYWGKDIKDHTRYSVRKLLTGNYQIVDDLAGESAYFLCADRNNTYAAYMYYFKDGVWHTDRVGTDSCNQNKPLSYSAVDICDVDVDNDSLYIKLKDVIKTWADPKPLYVLEAAPYFSEFPGSKGTTGFGKGHESGVDVSWSATVSGAVEVYFSQDVSFIVKIGSWSTGAIVEGSLSYEGSISMSKSVDVSYTNYSEHNAVIVERTPVYIYRYDVLGYDGQDTDPADVVVTGTPQTAMIPVEEYNDLAATYNSTHKNKVTLIDSSFGLGTPGDPMTYRKSFPNGKSNELFKPPKDDDQLSLTYYYGTEGSSEKVLGESSTLNNGYNIGVAFTSYAGGDLFGLGAKVSYTIGANQGTSFFQTDSVSCSGSVNMQHENPFFDFGWDMNRWLNKGITVVGYRVDVKEDDIRNLPPVQPKDLAVSEDVTNHSVNLTWTNPPTSSGRIKANYVDIYYKKMGTADYTMKRELLQGTEGTKSWYLTGLDRNTSYDCYIVNTYSSGNDIRQSYVSNHISFSTTNLSEDVDVVINHGVGVTLRSGSGSERQTVDAGATPRPSIQNVLYNVNTGYEIPNGFYDDINGIEAQSPSVGVIKVSGTPTANTTITIPDMDLIRYTITYLELNGATLNSDTKYSYTVEDTVTLPTLLRNGYIFDGWNYDGSIIASIPSGSTGDKNVYAQWTSLALLGYTQDYHADGSEASPYVISSEYGWDFFCECLENDKFDNFNGKHIRLDSDISVSTLAGSEAHKFGGIFDGNNHTLTFTCNTAASDYTAPFAYVEGTEDSPVTIKNLNVVTTITANDHQYTAGLVASQEGYTNIENCHVTVNLNTVKGTENPSDLYSAGLVGIARGTLNITGCTVTGKITTNGKFAGGFVAMTEANLNIKNCVSSVTIDSSVNGDGTHGGFIGVAAHNKNFNNHFEIEGCLFNGQLIGSSTTNCGGFVGYNGNGIYSSVKNSLFAPTQIGLSSGTLYNYSENFARNGITLDNSYYMTKLKGTQGKQAHSVKIGTAAITSDFGTATDTYSVSGITAYGAGVVYNNIFYAGEGDRVSLILGYPVSPATGYHFDGYKTGSETLPYSDNILTMPNADVVITAKNVANTYTVHFDPNVDYYYCGNTLRGSMEDQFFTYDEQEKALLTNQYHVPTAEVVNWNTEPDGSGTTYSDEQSVRNMTTENEAEITLYAQWRYQKKIVYDTGVFECLVGNSTQNVYWTYPGDTVRVNVIDFSAEYSDITVTDEDGNNVTFTDNTFIMPDKPVWINASSKLNKLVNYAVVSLDDYNSSDRVSYVYDENNPTVTPNVLVAMRGTEILTENEDYTVSIEGNTGNPDKIVTATVTVEGIGDYIGTIVTDFTITPFDIADCKVDGRFETYFNGYDISGALNENIEVWDGNTKMELYEDYLIEVDYEDVNFEAGQTYQGFVVGRGKWGGTQEFNFTVKELFHVVVFDANGGTGTMASDSVKRGDRYNYPECTFTTPEGKKFGSWSVSFANIYSDDTWVYSDSSGFTAPGVWAENEIGIITVKAEWIAPINDAQITLSEDSFDYDGTEKTVTYTVTLGDEELTAYEDFTFEGDVTATEPGVYIVKIKGVNSYYGEAKTTWKIIPPGITITVNGAAVEQDVEYNKSLTVTAPEAPTGEKFSHWTVNNNPVSYSATYSFIVKESVNLIPVYVPDETSVEQQAVLTLKTSKGVYNSKNAIKYTFSHSVPEGYTVTEVGLLYATNKLAGANIYKGGYATVNFLTDKTLAAEQYGVTDIENVVKNNTNGRIKSFVASYKKSNGTITFSYAIGTNTDAYTYAVGYVKAVNKATGETETLYSNFIATNYNNA